MVARHVVPDDVLQWPECFTRLGKAGMFKASVVCWDVLEDGMNMETNLESEK